MKKVNKRSSTVSKKNRVKAKDVTVFSQTQQRKNDTIRKVCFSLLYSISIVLLLFTLISAWVTIIIIIGLAQMIFLEPETSPFAHDKNMFYTIAGTFVVVGLYSSWKTWQSWFSPTWYWSFWWAIFPLLYCAGCVLLLKFL